MILIPMFGSVELESMQPHGASGFSDVSTMGVGGAGPAGPGAVRRRSTESGTEARKADLP